MNGRAYDDDFRRYDEIPFMSYENIRALDYNAGKYE
jgi:hypothetical protein